MKRRLVKLLSLCLMCMFAFSMMTGWTKQTEPKKVKIGMILYSYSDIQGKAMKAYGDYLQKNFNVEFIYEETHYDDSQQIPMLENLISKGVNAVISGYATSLPRCLQIANENKIYYGVALADIKDKADVTAAKNSKYFVGGIRQFGSDPGKLGAKYADAAYKAKVKNIGISTFYTYAFLDAPAIIDGFTKRIKELDAKNGTNTTIYKTLEHNFVGFDGDITTYIAKNPKMDCIFALGSGMDGVYPVIKNAGKSKNIKLLCLGYNDSTLAGIQDGSIVMAGTNNYSQIMASCFAQLYCAANGAAYQDAKLNGDVDYPTFTSVNGVKDFKTYVLGLSGMPKSSVTAYELKKVMKVYNPKATWMDLQNVVNRSVAKIKSVR